MDGLQTPTDILAFPLSEGEMSLGQQARLESLEQRVEQLQGQLVTQELQHAKSLQLLGDLLTNSTQASAALLGRVQSQMEHLTTLIEGLEKQQKELGADIVSLETLTRTSLPSTEKTKGEEGK